MESFSLIEGVKVEFFLATLDHVYIFKLRMSSV